MTDMGAFFAISTGCPLIMFLLATEWQPGIGAGGQRGTRRVLSAGNHCRPASSHPIPVAAVVPEHQLDRQRSEDRKADGDRLDRIETDIRSKRDMLFDAFQRGRVARPSAGLSVWAGIGSSGFYGSTES